ncbi:MAG: hypothetical protein K2Q09_06540 [Phycisphaerales bacterium]|nr:hypothetical protein [Phycisphaerales bacterium]
MTPPLAAAQGTGLGRFPDPDPLPSTPFFERFLLEQPVPTVVLLCIGAAVAWWLLQQRSQPRVAWITGAACIAAAAGVLVLAGAVTTTREALATDARALIEDAVEGRIERVAPRLREDLAVRLLGDERSDMTRATVIDRLRTDRATRASVTGARVRWVTCALDGPNAARTQARIVANTPLGDDTPTTWMLYWARDGERSPWRVRMIDGEQIGLMPLHSLSGY